MGSGSWLASKENIREGSNKHRRIVGNRVSISYKAAKPGKRKRKNKTGENMKRSKDVFSVGPGASIPLVLMILLVGML